MRQSDLTTEEQRLALRRMRQWEDRERLKVESLPPEEQDVVLELVALLNAQPVYVGGSGGGAVVLGARSRAGAIRGGRTRRSAR